MEEEKVLAPEEQELTPEQKAQQEENDRNFNTLKVAIEECVDKLFALDVPVATIEVHAVDLFRNYSRIKTSKSVEWDTFIKEKEAAEEKFYLRSAATLTYLTYDAATQTESVDSEDGV